MMRPFIIWIPTLPLLAFLALIFWGRRIGRLSGWLSAAALAASGAVVWGLAPAVARGRHLAVRWPWLSVGDPRGVVGFLVDGLSWLMLVVVTTVGTAITVYSIGYMRDDPRFSRFFAYLSLFCASMLGLVMADHFVLLYACWELVGLCSYLLISFWFEKPAAAAAGRKAFLTTRLGDAGLLIGLLLLAWTAGDLQMGHLAAIREQFLLDGRAALLTGISLLLLCGAAGKSAQIPLHVWLPDAMEGPTPVSALIHAATMVAAGVYLVARTLPLFTPQSLQVVLAIGLLTHLLAGTVALTMTDIKRILAYSTLSQLGLMMTALGLGAMSAAMFHLFTHAFFKALLFLGAGSVIHATHQQELAHLGGLRRQMPWTALVFLIAALSMSGLVSLSGFWSKDLILLAAGQAHAGLLVLLLVGAAMTSAYVFRLYFRCFLGAAPQPVHPSHHAHESPAVMVVPMAGLAMGAAFVGLVGSPWLGQPLFRLLGESPGHEGIDLSVVGSSTVALAVGIWLAWTVAFQRRRLLPVSLRPLGRRLYTLAARKYYVDEGYDRWLIQPFLRMTEAWARFDLRVIDGAVNRAGQAGWALSWLQERCDRLVDRLVNGLAHAIRGMGAALRWIQTGVVHQYLLVAVISVIVLSVLVHR